MWVFEITTGRMFSADGSLSGIGYAGGQCGSGGNLTDVIESQFNGYAAEEVVKEHCVSDVTPSTLEKRMNMLNLMVV